MKKSIIIAVFALFSLAAFGQEQEIEEVKDEHYINQIKSHYHLGSWEHTPEWWYNLWYNRYQRDYNNNATQFIPIDFQTENTKRKAENTQKNTDSIATLQTYQFIDKTVDIAYLLEAHIIDTLKMYVEKSIQTYSESESPYCEENTQLLITEYDNILESIEIIKGATVESTKKREEYLEIENKLNKLLTTTQKLNRLNAIYNKLKINN